MPRPAWFVATSLLVTSIGFADPWAGGSGAPRPVSSALTGPEAEHGDPQAQVTLPPVPAFEVPVAPAGTHSVRELLVAGRSLLDTDVKVTGYVTWIYDCVSATQKPGQSRAKVQKLIDQDPTRCERAKFYLGDAKDTPPEKSLWVVSVSRPYNKLEVERIKPADRTAAMYPDRCEPDPKRKGPFCVELATGDFVTLSGKFALSSPHSERNSDGLIVFASVAPAKPSATVTMRAVTAPLAKQMPVIAVKPVQKPPASEAARKDSLRRSNDGTRAYGQRDFAKAITEYQEATKAWEGNHVAWYGMAGAHIGTSDWRGAAASMAKAFELAPSDPMYAMVYGYTLYEQAIADARAAAAKRDGVPVAAVSIDLATVDTSRADQLLRHAVKLDDKLWRAHYYRGRIARDGGRAKDAADELTKALSSAPSQPGPWIALGELYRKWQFPELAITVADQGSKFVTGAAATDVWYVVGMANDDLRRDDAAIVAFTKALDLDPASAKAKFQRGRALFRKGKLEEAKRDLEAFVAGPDQLPFAKQQATKMLMDISAKKRP